MISMTFAQWNSANDEGEIEDLSAELPDAFLMVGQRMRAKIRYKNTVYIATAWVGSSVVLFQKD